MAEPAFHMAASDDFAESTINGRLSAISPDLNMGLIREVIIAAYDPYVNTLTEFSPLGAKSLELQMRVTEYLRSRLHKIGWDASDMEQVSSIVSEKDGVRIACSTDGGSGVGVENRMPILRTKGRGTIRLAGCERVITPPLPGMESTIPEDSLRKIDDLAFYYLLVHIDESRGEIRVELSRPVFDKNGETRTLMDRIILPAISISGESPVDTDLLPAPEIDVVRRVS